jgi:hypothetical protein
MPDRVSVGLGDGGLGAEAMPRSDFLRRALFTGAAVTGGGVALAGVPGLVASSAPSAGLDVQICNFFLVLERLQFAFYEEANASGALTGELEEFSATVVEHEREHVEFLEDMLGAKADPAPAFDVADAARNPSEFGRAALLLEETTAAAYIGQGPNMTSGKVLSAARVAAVEARHAAWIRDVLGMDPAPAPAAQARSEKQVMSSLRDAGFIV